MTLASASVAPADSNLLNAAVALAREAGDITLEHFQTSTLGVEFKDDNTPVTIADRSAEAHVRSRLAELFPRDAIIGEEDADAAGTSDRTWVIDPIDGTKSFTHGVPLYSNLIAVVDEHGPAVGVINLPALGETVWAGRGLGCFLNGDPCSVSTVDRLDRAAMSASQFEGFPPAVFAKWSASGAIIRTWGDGYGYALLATGRLEAMVDHGCNWWDIAPMRVIIPEAGGRITGWDRTENPEGGSIMATNGALHDTFLNLVAID